MLIKNIFHPQSGLFLLQDKPILLGYTVGLGWGGVVGLLVHWESSYGGKPTLVETSSFL